MDKEYALMAAKAMMQKTSLDPFEIGVVIIRFQDTMLHLFEGLSPEDSSHERAYALGGAINFFAGKRVVDIGDGSDDSEIPIPDWLKD
ncbi:hypothetical protein ACFL2R_01595 [Patescibacteria group bacterium]